MSGFIALYNLDGRPVDAALLKRLTDRLKRRAPDRQATWTDGPVGLSHALFATTEQAVRERLPFSLDNEIWLTGYLRLDDRETLCDRLGLKKDIDLSETPDSTLVLHAYHAWGEQCVEQLMGDFAFVIWDRRRQRLFCARDHFGIRKLYHARTGDTLVVGNVLEVLLAHPGISRDLNPQAIGDFLLFGDHTGSDKRQTAFADIRSLQPAHVLSVNDGKPRDRRYWHFPLQTPLRHHRTEADCLEHFMAVFRAVIQDRLRTPRTSIAFSGGMDSSSIAATLLEQGMGTQLQGVSGQYHQRHPSDEYHYTRLAAERLALPVRYLDADPYPLLQPMLATTRPLALYQPQLWYDMEKLALEHSRVLLCGNGGDELFAFSSLAVALRAMNPLTALLETVRLRRRYGATPGLGLGIKTAWRRRRGGEPDQPYPYPGWLNPDFEREWDLKNRWRAQWNQKRHPLHARHPRVHEHLTSPEWGLEDLLLAPPSSLPEERYPYLDLRLIDFVLSLPPLPWLFRKHLQRRAMAGRLPDAVLARPKTPLGYLHVSLLRQPEAAWVKEWRPSPGLETFINREARVVPVDGEDPAAAYVNLRPLMLDHWRRALAEKLAQE